MNAVTPIGRSVRDAALGLINAAETLRETRAESLSVADAMRERQRRNQAEYFGREDRANELRSPRFRGCAIEPVPVSPVPASIAFAGDVA